MYVHHVSTEAGGKLKRCVFYHGIFLQQQRGESQALKVVTVKLSCLTDRMSELGPKMPVVKSQIGKKLLRNGCRHPAGNFRGEIAEGSQVFTYGICAVRTL